MKNKLLILLIIVLQSCVALRVDSTKATTDQTNITTDQK